MHDTSLSRDLFAELALGCIVAATVEVSFFVCSGSVTARGLVEMSVFAMVSMTSAGGVPSSDTKQTHPSGVMCWSFFVGKLRMKTKRLQQRMMVIREKRRNLVDELRSVIRIVVVEKAAEFVSETIRKDNAQIEKLSEIESEMEARALKKELHVQKIVGNIPY
nr:hypothetical protein [Tanacetum cinerariifolium]